MKMNPEVKARWVAALRSGEYRQTRAALKDVSGMCCLGVLCDIHDATAWRPDGSYLEEGFDEMPPLAVKRWAGLATGHTNVVIGGNDAPLAEHNDCGCTFAEIANAIEAQL